VRAVRRTVLFTTAAASVTGLAVTGGVLAEGSGLDRAIDTTLVAGGLTAAHADDVAADRAPVVSRADRRDATDTLKLATLSTGDSPGVTQSEDLSDADPRTIAAALLPEYGFSSDQFTCLDSLYMSESGWRVNADNPTSSAYGIPQALTSMHDLPPDYMTSAESQIRWGLEYIQNSYGTPCNAWSFKAGHGWY